MSVEDPFLESLNESAEKHDVFLRAKENLQAGKKFNAMDHVAEDLDSKLGCVRPRQAQRIKTREVADIRVKPQPQSAVINSRVSCNTQNSTGTIDLDDHTESSVLLAEAHHMYWSTLIQHDNAWIRGFEGVSLPTLFVFGLRSLSRKLGWDVSNLVAQVLALKIL